MSEATELARITELMRQNHLAISVPEYLRTMACVHLETGRRVLPRYIDDEVFRYAADELERLEGAIWKLGADVLSLQEQLQAALSTRASSSRAETAPTFIMCEACGSIVADPPECDCTKLGYDTQRLVGLYRGEAPASSQTELAEARRLALEDQLASAASLFEVISEDLAEDDTWGIMMRVMAKDIRALASMKEG
jgi:hypothetical protein